MVVATTQMMENPPRKPLSVGRSDNGNGEGNGNGRRGQIETTASSGGAPVVTVPQCLDCSERRMRVQSMEARCFLEI